MNGHSDPLSDPLVDVLVDRAFIFKSLDDAQRGWLKQQATVRPFSAGQVLMREDEEGLEMLIIAAGEVNVSQLGATDDVFLATLGEGAVVGEVAVLTDTPRTSTVVAKSNGRAICFTREVIDQLVQRHPRVKNLLMKLIEGRARHTITTIGV